METPAGYVTNEEVIAFDAQYQGQDIKVAKYSSLFLNTPTTFEFAKEDITSGAELSGATLCVIDKDGNINKSDYIFVCAKIKESCIKQEGVVVNGLVRRRNTESLMAQQ